MVLQHIIRTDSWDSTGGTKYAIDFDLVTLGTVGNEIWYGTSSAIEDYGNGWYRCVINVTFATGCSWLVYAFK